MGPIRLVSMFVLLSLTSAAFAQSLMIGTPYRDERANFASLPFNGPRTYLDVSRGSNASGTVNRITFGWQEAGCREVARILFLRNLGDELVVIATRGPFDGPQSGRVVTVELDPPVEVHQGDLVGLSQLTACGSPAAQLEPPVPFSNASSELFPFEVTDRVSLALVEYSFGRLLLEARGLAREQVTAIIPVVISGAGAFGSHFRTSVQIHNPFPRENVNGRLVFHPAGRIGGFDDPSIAFSLKRGETRHFPDIVAAFGNTGMGSVDVVTDLEAGAFFFNADGTSIASLPSEPELRFTPTPLPAAPPATTVRVEASSSSLPGTYGLSEPMIQIGGGFTTPERVIGGGSIGVLATPANPEGFRMNVGVRTLFSGATIVATTFDAAGNAIASRQHRFPSTWFEQMDAATFTGTPLPANGSIHIMVTSGQAIVYGSTVNNGTQDGSMEFVRHLNSRWFALAPAPPP